MIYHYTSYYNYMNYIWSSGLLRAKSLFDLVSADNPDGRDLKYPINLLFKRIRDISIGESDENEAIAFFEWVKTYTYTKETFQKIKSKIKSLSILCTSSNGKSSYNINNLNKRDRFSVVIPLDEEKIITNFLVSHPKIYKVEYLEYDKDLGYFVEDFPIKRLIEVFNDVISTYIAGRTIGIEINYEDVLVELLTYLVAIAKPNDKNEEEEVRVIIDLDKLKQNILYWMRKLCMQIVILM